MAFRLATLTAVAAAALMFPAAVLAEPASVTTSVNMRSGPGIGYSVLQVLPARAQVDAVCEPGRTWCQVNYAGRAGWISAAYLDDVAAVPPAPLPTPIGTTPANFSADITNNVNMRTGPGVGYSAVRTLPAGTRVNVTQCAQGSSWCQVSYAGATGWVSRTYLRDVGMVPQPVPLPTPIATIPANTSADIRSTVNMRTGPGAGYSAMGSLTTGTRVNVTRCTQDGGWCEVSSRGSTGWVSAAYLDDVDIGPQPAPSPYPTTPASFTADVTAAVNMRAGAGVGYSVLRSLPAGTRVNVNSCTQDGGWCQVNYAGSNGWVASRYLVDVATGQVATRPTVGDAVRQGIGAILDGLQRR